MLTSILRVSPMLLKQIFEFAIIGSILGQVSLFIGESLPRKNFNFNRHLFKQCKWENEGKFYLKLKIHYWKDKLPDASRFIKSMFPKKLPVTSDANYMRQLIVETCIAEMVHMFLIAISPIFLLLMDPGWGQIFMIIHAIGNAPFIMIQRYNRPRLMYIMEHKSLKEKTKVNESITTTGCTTCL